MGKGTDAARAEVLAAREGLGEELVRLEAAGRAAVDIPARIRREPAKVLGAAGGAAFLLLGGPKRAFKGVRRAIFGPQADLPKSMLPPEVEATLRKLGPDGEKVRGTLEREFADYLEEKAPQRRERDLGAVAAGLLGGVLRPVTTRAGKELIQRLFEADNDTFGEALRRARGRQGGGGASGSGTFGNGTGRSGSS
ncbi:MAG TPA: hypothetical protein VF484_08595 [Candidatus Limnocylindrales bacterium]